MVHHRWAALAGEVHLPVGLASALEDPDLVLPDPVSDLGVLGSVQEVGHFSNRDALLLVDGHIRHLVAGAIITVSGIITISGIITVLVDRITIIIVKMNKNSSTA